MEEYFASISEAMDIHNKCMFCQCNLLLGAARQHEIDYPYVLYKNTTRTAYSIKINVETDEVYVYDTDNVNGILFIGLNLECPQCNRHEVVLSLKIDVVNAKLLKISIGSTKFTFNKYIIRNVYSFGQTILFEKYDDFYDRAKIKEVMTVPIINNFKDPTSLLTKLQNLLMFK